MCMKQEVELRLICRTMLAASAGRFDAKTTDYTLRYFTYLNLDLDYIYLDAQRCLSGDLRQGGAYYTA